MPQERTPLPSFERPPLIEVVCGVQFNPPVGFGTVHLGRLHNAVADEYPEIEEQPPLAEVFEGPSGVETRAEMAFDLPPLRRLFFKTKDDAALKALWWWPDQSAEFIAKRTEYADKYKAA